MNIREVPGYRLELTPFGGIKDSGLGYKEGVQEAMKSFTNVEDVFPSMVIRRTKVHPYFCPVQQDLNRGQSPTIQDWKN